MKMRRMTLLMLCVFVASGIMAQSRQKHLEFMDTYISGKLNTFLREMIKKSFTLEKINEDGTAIMKGDFGGYKDCDLYIYTTGPKHTVYSVVVSLPYRETWAALSDDYYSLKKKMKKKLGDPDTFLEEFDNPGIPEDWKMMYVRTGRCNFRSTFGRDYGTITLMINNVVFERDTYSNVRIVYLDNMNEQDRQ